MDDNNPALLEPGYAGELTYGEALYIKEHLERSPKLRRIWNINGKGRIPLTTIAVKVYPEDPAYARRHILSEQGRANRKNQRIRKN